MSNVKLIQGDCLEKMKEIPDKSIDMVLGDLPYGLTSCDWDKIIPMNDYVIIKDKKYDEKQYLEYAYKNNIAYKDALKYFNENKKIGLWTHYMRVIKDNGVIALFGVEPFSTVLRISNLKNYKYDIIWMKNQATNPLCCKKKIMPIHENISIFYKKQPTYNPQMRKGFSNYKGFASNKLIGEIYGKNLTSLHRECKNGERYPISVLNYNNIRMKLHPTQKPIDLLEYLVKTYTNENETVLDNCMGSGSTGVACINTNRNFIGIELDGDYFNIAKERIEKTIKEKQNEQN